MRISVAALILACLATPAYAQAPDQEQMKKNLEEKLAKPFVTVAPWILDFDEAKAASKKSGKPIFAYFTRSYAN
jgi:hypothetical protein